MSNDEKLGLLNDESEQYDPKATMRAVDRYTRSLAHYGTPRHSGRYPYGSGENPYQHELDFLGNVQKLSSQGLSEKEIAYSMGMTTSEFRKTKAIANNKTHAYDVAMMNKLYEKGLSRSAVARRMGRNESTLRSWENEERQKRMSSTARNADLLKSIVDNDEYGYIDVGAGIEHHLHMTKHAMGNALKMLKDQGYEVLDVSYEQLGTGNRTTFQVLCPPGTEKYEVRRNLDKIKPPVELYSEDGGHTLRKIEPPVSIDSKRVEVCYAEDGGKDKDGLIELRRGVEDISLKNAKYAQVRIAVDGTHYLKGMAVYADDLPSGIDIRFNTNKTKDVPMINKENPDKSVLKKMKDDPDNPFGATILDDSTPDYPGLIRAQRHYIGSDGKEHLSALNIVSEEGTWYKWGRRLASQFLSKQPPSLAKQQLDLAKSIAQDELKEIMSYNNPLVRQSMLEEYARKVDSDAVHLVAAALPRQSNCVILPLKNTKDTEIYAPGYNDGEQVALVRYPHAGVMEIPILTVNNNNPEARRILGTNPIDAVGINSKVASRLSGADFDGDTVLVLPTDKVKIRATANNRPSAYKSLEDFDDKAAFPYYEGMHVMTKQEHGREMGSVSNLITDMNIKGASDAEKCRAIKHSMVVVDAQKHKLDYKRSEEEFRIAELKEKYQGSARAGASTLLSRSTAPANVPDRKLKAFSKMSDAEKKRYLNGENIYEYTGPNGMKRQQRYREPDPKLLTKDEKKKYKDASKLEKRLMEREFIKEGKMRYKYKDVYIESLRGAEEDPWSLVSRTPDGKMTRKIEAVYAQYATEMHELARQARAAARQIEIPKRDPQARLEYIDEVRSLEAKVKLAELNSPKERQAQRIATTKFRAYKYAHPEEDDEHLTRKKGQLLDESRKIVGAKKLTIGGSSRNPLTDREWEAIQKNAVTPTLLRKILANSDSGRIKELALPRTKTGLSSAKLSRAKSMLAKGYSRADVCDMLDIGMSTLVNAIGIENM